MTMGSEGVHTVSQGDELTAKLQAWARTDAELQQSTPIKPLSFTEAVDSLVWDHGITPENHRLLPTEEQAALFGLILDAYFARSITARNEAHIYDKRSDSSRELKEYLKTLAGKTIRFDSLDSEHPSVVRINNITKTEKFETSVSGTVPDSMGIYLPDLYLPHSRRRHVYYKILALNKHTLEPKVKVTLTD